MKIKLADGTEVEVADNDPVAIAHAQLEKVKSLGFDSIEAYQNSRESELERLKKQTASDQEFINRQKNELGELRKKTGEQKPEEKPDEKQEQNKVETPEEREARYGKLNDALQANLTDEQRKHAEKEFEKAYKEATPQDRALLNTEEGKHSFMELVFPSQATEDNPVSLFRKPETKPLSISERVKAALKESDQGRSRRPVIPNVSGSGFRPKNGEEPPKKTVPQSVARSGGVLDAVKALEQT